MQKVLRVLIPIAILTIGWFGFGWLSKEKPSEKRPPPPKRVLKTKVLPLNRQDYQTTITTQGVVRAHNEASLTAQVSGKVKSISEQLQDGAFFEEGDVLLEIDPEDLAAGVVSAEADLARASAAFSQEEARGKQAKLNWEDLGYTEEPNDLVLRLPQRREAEANLNAAKANLERAQRDLERAKVRAPFDGRVLQRSVAIGQSITSSTVLAVIFNTAFVEIRLPIASDQLGYLKLPESPSDPPLDVTFYDALNSENLYEWQGQITGTEGSLDEGSRELFAIARVDDPFNRERVSGEGDQRPALRIGQPVRAAIVGRVLEDVFVIPRIAVRQLNRITLVDRDKMVIERREIEELWSNLDEVIVRDPEIPDQTLLATTRMLYSPSGSPVEILPDSAEEEAEADATTAAKTKLPDET